MQTPAHIAASLFVYRKESTWTAAGAIVVGALLPDLPMFGFYAYQKLVGSTEKHIWEQLYFDESWQLSFDWFNSIPLATFLMLIGFLARWRWLTILSGSALLHLLMDLPVHHDDGHRHFLPFSQFRFESPVSYWDPKRFGIPFAIVELVLAVSACVWVAIYSARPLKIAAFLVLAMYALVLVLLLIWLISRLW